MKCDICGTREAVLFIQETTKSSSVELHLCTACAKERGIMTGDEKKQKIEFSLGHILSGMFTNGKEKQPELQQNCPGCGLTLPDIRKKRGAGCPECYTTFKAEILGILRSTGAAPAYTGSLPKKLAHFQSRLTDRMTLQTRLQTAISAENYEMAALYRDRLRILDEGTIGGTPEGAFGAGNGV
ncbi:MAG: UvrB/UvrC motif-containing protein [Spirochaetaceae bacterium]|jgi:protein arginine kinase activator|nr:UvrB/UvrC motif-containing protein [Spirochaetaceae bacterium]